MHRLHFLLLGLATSLSLGVSSEAATVLVVQFHNSSEYPDLNWVGESIADTLMREFGSADEIVLQRNSRGEGLRRLSLHAGAEFTKATVMRLGETLDADYVCYGSFEVTLLSPDAQLKDSSVRITAHIIDLRKLHDGPDLSEAGRLSDLSRLEEHLAWQSLKYVRPETNWNQQDFLGPGKLIRLDAEESYIRGLLSTSKEQQQKWFKQAVILDPQFVPPAYELGKLALKQHDYAQATQWLKRVSSNDQNYPEVRFDLGISAYQQGNYTEAATYFRDLAKAFPLGEVYNNLGAAESHANVRTAIDDLRRAFDGDPKDTTYTFNLGLALFENNNFDEAVKRFQTLVERDPTDAESRSLLQKAESRQSTLPGSKPPAQMRLKESFNEPAFRELKAMLQPKTSR